MPCVVASMALTLNVLTKRLMACVVRSLAVMLNVLRTNTRPMRCVRHTSSGCNVECTAYNHEAVRRTSIDYHLECTEYEHEANAHVVLLVVVMLNVLCTNTRHMIYVVLSVTVTLNVLITDTIPVLRTSYFQWLSPWTYCFLWRGEIKLTFVIFVTYLHKHKIWFFLTNIDTTCTQNTHSMTWYWGSFCFNVISPKGVREEAKW